MQGLVHWFVCCNGYGHINRTRLLYSYIREAYPLLGDSIRFFLIGYEGDDEIEIRLPGSTYLKIGDPMTLRRSLIDLNRHQPDFCISDNLFAPLTITTAKKRLFIGTFSWLALSDDVDNRFRHIEDALCSLKLAEESKATILANKYFYSKSLLPLGNELKLHSIISSPLRSKDTSSPLESYRDIIISLGRSPLSRYLLPRILSRLSEADTSGCRFVIDESIYSDSAASYLDRLTITWGRYTDCYQYYHAFILRPGLGSISEILGKNDRSVILPAFENCNQEMSSNALRLKELGVSPLLNILSTEPSELSSFFNQLSNLNVKVDKSRFETNGLNECCSLINGIFES